MIKKRSLALFISLIIMTIGGYLVSVIPQQAPEINGTIFTPARNILPFTLKTDASTFNESNLQNKWSIVFFGYTQCQEICPTTLNMLNDFITQAAHKISATKLPQIIFVSLDPEHDSPTAASNYAKLFNTNFIGAAGDRATIKELSQEFGVVANMRIVNNSAIIDHSSHMFVINPRGEVQAILSAPHTSANLVRDFSAIINNYG